MADFFSSREVKRRKLNPTKHFRWLCCSLIHSEGCCSRPTVKFLAVFEHRVSALLYAYCISDVIEDLDPECFHLKIKTENGYLYSNQYPWRVPKIEDFSVHFHGSYYDQGDLSFIQVVPVLMDAHELGSHVEIIAELSGNIYERRRYVLQIVRIRRVNILDRKYYRKKFDREKDSVTERYRCAYVSTLISCPKHLLESYNPDQNNDTNYFSAIQSLYPLDIVSKLGDIISVIFPKIGQRQPLYCVDRIVAFLLIDDILSLLHYGLPSKNVFDQQRMKEDILCCLPKSLISVPVETGIFRPVESIQTQSAMRYRLPDESSALKCSSEEFWILFNKSLKNPHPYLKNEIKVNGLFRPLFVIPIEYRKGYIRNGILRIRSFLLSKNALHLVENEAVKIQSISRIADGTRVSFSTTLIQAIFTDHGSQCPWWYSELEKQSPKHKQRLENVDWDEFALYIDHPSRRQIIMLTDEFDVDEDINESPCEISRAEKCLPWAKTLNNDQDTSSSESDDAYSLMHLRDDGLEFCRNAAYGDYWIEDPYTPHRRRLNNHLKSNFKRIHRSYAKRKSFNPLRELWKLLADTFGISNCSIIKSEDEITPTTIPNDFVVMSFRNVKHTEHSRASSLRLAIAHCLRNNKSAIRSSVATALDDETPCVQLNVLQLSWDRKLHLFVGKAKIDISRSGSVLLLCGSRGLSLGAVELGPFLLAGGNSNLPEIYQLIALLMPLKFRPVQVWFPD